MGREEKIIYFWCHRCRLDWKLLAQRGSKNSVFPDVWIAKCPECKVEMIRLINDATNDVYFHLSKKTRVDTKKRADELIQMDDPRFDILYPQHKREREEKQALAEKKQWEVKQSK